MSEEVLPPTAARAAGVPAPRPSAAGEQFGQGLAQKSMGPVEVLAQSVAAIAPSAVMATGPALIVLSAGSGTWLSYLFATVTVLLIGYCVAQFATRIASAGSLYSYVASSIGATPAFAAGWGLVVGYTMIAIVGVAGFGIYGGSLLEGMGIPATSTGALVALFLVAALAAVAFAAYGIKLSTRVGLVLEIFSVAALLILFAVVLAQNGLSLDTAQLRAEGSTLDGVTFGMVLAVLGFVGFESAASLGAEAKDPHRAIPRAVLASGLIVGVMYVVATYASIAGLGVEGLGSSAAPMNDLAEDAGIGGFRFVIDVGVAASFFAVAIASVNAAARVLYTMARERVLPDALGRTHPRHRTPHVAILALLPVLALLPIAMVLLGRSALDVYAYTGTIGTFGYMTAYLLMAVGMPVFLAARGERRAVHVVVAALACAALVYVVFKNLVPAPPSPFDVLPYLYAGVLALGLGWFLVLRARHPERARLVGTYDEETPPVPDRRA